MTTSSYISSISNPKIKWLRKLLADRTTRDEAGLFIAEGIRLVEDAVTIGWQPVSLFYAEDLGQRGSKIVEAVTSPEKFVLSAELMQRVAGTDTSQGLIAVFTRPVYAQQKNLDFVLIADNIRDPGNLGTLLRSAASAGVLLCLVSPQSVDVWSPKVIRAGMGAHFHLPVQQLSWDEIEQTCLRRDPPLTVMMAEAEAEIPYWDANLNAPVALLIGSEAEGPSSEGRRMASQSVSIPMPGNFESLNAAIAGSILLFEAVRQRSKYRALLR